jgi:histidyl-tRNA synthetase
MTKKYASPRGTIDFLPPESMKLLLAEAIFRDVAEKYGYLPVRTPRFEATELFARGAGESSDIVSKEMYTFPDKKGRSMTLRPEGTPGVARALIQAGWNFGEQTRLYYVGSMFRYQRPQKGRYREHTQVGVEIFGASSVTADVEVISLGVNFLNAVGLENLRVAVNSLGSVEDRTAYNEELKKFIAGKMDDFCPECHFRTEHNPLRVFDCKVQSCRDTLKKAPKIDGIMCDESRIRFATLQEMLREEGFAIDVDPMLVRGLDYYNHTVFEVMMEGDEGQQSSLMGGGRYDGLVKLYGGPDTPAMGFGSGLERVAEAVDWSDVAELFTPECDLAIVALGDEALRVGTTMANLLRVAGIAVHIDHRGSSFKNQLGQANSLNAETAVIIGDNELKEGIVIIKDMESGEQENVPLDEVVAYILEIFNEDEE